MLNLKSKTGSLTIEATIVSTIVILCVVMLIYIGFILYQQVRLEAIATVAAERGAIVYSNPTRDMYIGKIDSDQFAKRNPYWRILEFRADKQAKLNKIENYINLNLNYNNSKDSFKNSKDVLKLTNINVVVDVKDWINYKKIQVDLTGQYTVPIGGIFELFGLTNPFPVKAQVESVFVEPAELVRNADLAKDVVMEIDENLGGNVQAFFKKVSNGFNKIIAFFNK